MEQICKQWHVRSQIYLAPLCLGLGSSSLLCVNFKENKGPFLPAGGLGLIIKSAFFTEDGKEIDFQLNLGEGKYYPAGLKCTYNDKLVDCCTFASDSVELQAISSLKF